MAGAQRLLTVLLGVSAIGLLAAPLLTTEPLERVNHFAEHRPANIAHAGAQGHAPPNTLEAFQLAVDLGADTLEMDLQLSADNEVVVHHDGTVGRQTDGAGAIREMTVDELRELDAGYAFTDEDGTHPYRGEGVRIPTLEEVFEAFPEQHMVLEMKREGGTGTPAAVTDRVRAHGREDRVILASFELDFVREARERLPGVLTAMSVAEVRQFHMLQLFGLHRWWQPPGEFLQIPEFYAGIHVTSHRFLSAADEIGVDTHVWTVNDPDTMRRLLAAGAHGIITDHTERMVEVTAERAAGAPHPEADSGNVALTVWLQDRLGWLTPAMAAITFLGHQEFYVVAFPLLYWAVSRRVGLRVGVLLLVSAGINEAGKLAGRTPRPSFVVPELGAVSEHTFGIPSGHAQHGLVVWGALAAEVRRHWAWVAALVLVLLLSASRIHLGVHYPADVLAGWAVGGALLIAYLRWRNPVEAWLATRRPMQLVGLALAASVALIALAAGARVVFLDWQPPATWVGIGPDTWPIGLSHAVTPAGALFGLGAGVALLRAYGGFDAGGPLWQRALRCLFGLVGVVLLWQGLGALFPAGEDPIALAYRWVRYAAVGVWVGGGAPLAFVRLGLAPAAVSTPSQPKPARHAAAS
ncbi:glycerophosphodiester phosphodiesterase family protein [Aquisalimonas sp.]|uniref:glycerophosphodiester phosphodiesterase family protein n=1 Tax=Aquisalimonas sp. TaxID=1872621 RepID=UPI0025C00A29|nr:glycerophosphodiester phosphodiesterase family protein [Aquisalimonas sp.]